jgi:acetyl/propionyl-CoA carboxylase alpha subunit
MNHPAFVEGKYDTHFVSRYFNTRNTDKLSENEDIAAIAAALIFQEKSIKQNLNRSGESKKSNWKIKRM